MPEKGSPGSGGLFYLPGWLYDAALGVVLRGVRRRVAAAVAAEGLFPCLDVCCGTGSQIRAFGARRADGSGAHGPVIGLDSHPGMIRYASARMRRPGAGSAGAAYAGAAPAGSAFVVGDALRLPFKNASFRTLAISFGLHDKSPEERMAIAAEARRVLSPGGKMILVDFEKPWNAKSRLGAFLVHVIERMAGGAHYRNGRLFLARGGLRAFVDEAGFKEKSRHDIEMGSTSIVECEVRHDRRPA